MTFRLSAIIVLTVGLGTPAWASDDFMNAFNACTKISEDSARLACFDSLKTNKHIAAAAPSKAELEDDFGSEDIKARHNAKESSRAASITVGLIEAGTTRSGKYFFVLANGQVWRQLKADTSTFRIPKRLGDVQVEIRRKSLGAHVLKIVGKSRSLKVQRIR